MSKEPAKRGAGFFDVVQRTEKPRKTGLTLIADQGSGINTVTDWLDAWGDYVDYAKLYHMTPAYLPEEFVKRKIALYRKYDVYPMAGGIYLEMAHCQEKTDQAISYLGDMGFGAVELSENFVEFTPEQEEDIIKKCLKAGLRVIFEYGDKYYAEGQDVSVDTVAKRVQRAKNMGVHHTIIEESVMDLWLGKDGKGKEAHKLVELADRVGRDHIIWEAGQQVQNAHLVRLFGPDVNLGPNIQGDTISWLECGRRGIGRAFGYQVTIDAFKEYKARHQGMGTAHGQTAARQA